MLNLSRINRFWRVPVGNGRQSKQRSSLAEVEDSIALRVLVLGLVVLRSEGMTYTVLSEVPYRDRTLLGKADTKYPKEIKDYYLQIPLAYCVNFGTG